MSLNQGIEHGKEWRKEYTGSKAINKTCRNHGSCPWYQENRQYKHLKKEEAMKERYDSWSEYGCDDNMGYD